MSGFQLDCVSLVSGGTRWVITTPRSGSGSTNQGYITSHLSVPYCARLVDHLRLHELDNLCNQTAHHLCPLLARREHFIVGGDLNWGQSKGPASKL